MIRTGLIWTIGMIGVMFVIALCVWFGISDAESVPVHWNAAGEADGFASPTGAMFIYWAMIGLSVFLGGLFAGLPMLKSVGDDLLRTKKLYLSIWLGTIGFIVVLTAFVGWVTYASVRGVLSSSPDFTIVGFLRVILAIASVGIIMLGNYLPKTRQNNVIGIRTRKSLSDTENWERTHRYAGKAFFIAGVICFALACFAPLLWAAIIWSMPVLLACLFSYGYSSRLSV